MSDTPKSMDELYPRPWVTAADLNGKAVTVKIASVVVETFFVPQIGQAKTAAVLAFEGKTKRLVLNKTQCRALAQLTGSQRFADWIGHTVALAPAQAPNGKRTIAIQATTETTKEP